MVVVPLKRQVYPTKRDILLKRDVRARQEKLRQQRILEEQRKAQREAELQREAFERGGIVYKGKIIIIPKGALTSKEDFRQFRIRLSEEYKRVFGRTPSSKEISDIQRLGLQAYPRRTMATPTAIPEFEGYEPEQPTITALPTREITAVEEARPKSKFEEMFEPTYLKKEESVTTLPEPIFLEETYDIKTGAKIIKEYDPETLQIKEREEFFGFAPTPTGTSMLTATALKPTQIQPTTTLVKALEPEPATEPIGRYKEFGKGIAIGGVMAVPLLLETPFTLGKTVIQTYKIAEKRGIGEGLLFPAVKLREAITGMATVFRSSPEFAVGQIVGTAGVTERILPKGRITQKAKPQKTGRLVKTPTGYEFTTKGGTFVETYKAIPPSPKTQLIKIQEPLLISGRARLGRAKFEVIQPRTPFVELGKTVKTEGIVIGKRPKTIQADIYKVSQRITEPIIEYKRFGYETTILERPPKKVAGVQYKYSVTELEKTPFITSKGTRLEIPLRKEISIERLKPTRPVLKEYEITGIMREKTTGAIVKYDVSGTKIRLQRYDYLTGQFGKPTEVIVPQMKGVKPSPKMALEYMKKELPKGVYEEFSMNIPKPEPLKATRIIREDFIQPKTTVLKPEAFTPLPKTEKISLPTTKGVRPQEFDVFAFTKEQMMKRKAVSVPEGVYIRYPSEALTPYKELQIGITETVTRRRIAPIPMLRTITKPIQRTLPIQIAQQIPQQIPETTLEQIPETISKQIPISITRQIPQQVPIQIPEQIPEVIPETVTQQVPRTVTYPYPEPLPLLPSDIRKRRIAMARRRIPKSYQAYIKEKGKFKKVGRPTTRQSALDLGSEIVDKTPSSQFRIVETKKAPKSVPAQRGYFSFNMFKFRPYKIRKGRRFPMTEQFIEKRRFRIDSEGERRGITAKGLKAIKRKSLLGSMPKLNLKRLI